jgi:DNA-binding NarL/FixJ family response regulator
MPPTIRVIIADDHALFRQGLKSILRLNTDVTVVAEVGRVSEIAATLESTPCDILLLDLQMDRNSLAEIGGLARRVQIVVVTASEDPADAVSALRAGARAVVFKRFAIETLLTALGVVMDGHVWMPPSLQAEFVAQMSRPPTEALTAREREIVRLVALGFNNPEIAERLSISDVTVKTHLNNVFRKLKVRDRVALARHAIRSGLVGIHEKSD